MKKLALLISLILSASAFATDYTITGGYYGTKTYQDYDTLLMTGGGDTFRGEDYSVLDIRNTSPLAVLSGGIWELIIKDNSQLIFSGGQVYWFDIGNYATAVLSGGRIDKIESGYYYADPEHIKIICQTYNYNTTTKILTGAWRDDSAFSIQLIDIGYGYTSTWSNITIIPEPMTLLLLSLGGILIRRK